MNRASDSILRGLWLGIALAVSLATSPVRAAAEEALPVSRAQADPHLAPVARGFDLWLQTRLVAAGVAIADLPPAANLVGFFSTAAEHGYGRALVPRLHERDGQTTIRLVLYASGSGAVLMGTREAAPTADLGRTAHIALQSLIPQIGGTPDASAPPPLLEDLVNTTLALEAREDGDLAAAWHAVQGKLTPNAMRVRDEIADAAHSTGGAAATRARVMSAAGDPATAWSLIAREAPAALEADAPDVDLLVAAGEIQLARSNPRDAIRYFERAIEADPRHPDARFGLAEILELRGEVEASAAELQRAAELAPSDPRPVERLARIERDPQRAAAHWIEAGRRSAQRMDARGARSQFERAASTHPGAAPRAESEIGALEERLGRPAEALVAYRRAVDGGARTPELLTAVGRSHLALGEREAAEEALRSAVELDANHAGAARELGVLYTETGRATEAIPLLRAAHSEDPGDDRARRTLASALRATGDTDEALRLLAGDAITPTSVDLRVSAEIQIERGELSEARDSLVYAVELEPDDPDLRERLAQVLDRIGDAAGAVAARQIAAALDTESTSSEKRPNRAVVNVLSLDDLVRSFSEQVSRAPERRIALLGVKEPGDLRTWAWRLVRPRSPDLARISHGIEAAIDARFDRARIPAEDDETLSVHIDRLFDFEQERSLNAEMIATVNQVLSIDGAFVTRLLAHDPSLAEACGPDSLAIEVRLLLGRDPELASILSNSECLDGGLEAYGTWNITALGLYLALALFVGWPVIRGWGAIRVSIRLPERTKGFFSIHVTKKPDQVKREQIDKKTQRKKTQAKRRLDFLKRFERHMAGRDTTLRWIPARSAPYTVTVSGPLLDARGEEIIGHFLEEQQVTVRRGRAAVLEFDFRPKECAVEVRVDRDGHPANGARVAILGDPSSLRYARDGVAFQYLGLGEYTVLVGDHDRAARFDIEITSLDSSIPLHVDLEPVEGLVFADCPEAVDAYLQSDFATAADALDAAGNTSAAHLIRANLYARQGRSDEAARELEAAGRLGGAAELRASSDDHTGSAALFEQAGEHGRAGDAHRAAGAWAEAGRCYELAYDYGNAVECWREAGDVEREMVMLEKLGEYMDAANLAIELGQEDRAVHNLQLIDGRHALYGDACRKIAEIAHQRGDHDLAIAKVEEAIESVGSANASVETLEVYAKVLEAAGRREQAIGAYEAIRRRDVERADVAMRIQELKRELDDSESATQDIASQKTEPQTRESRYELLEEIGRGGMGVVYKARDKRLGRVVALKQLPANLRDHPAALQLFEREARAAAALNHVNIVTLFDAGEENGAYFITMELLEGRPLNVIVEQNNRVSVRDSLRLGIQICAGLQYAHDRRIVHRDIKTANLFFTRDQVMKIMDFGIAKSMEEVRRSTTVIGGTPYYMAPEQASGEAVDHRADIYAFGVTMFQMTTGSLPFRDGDVSFRHRHEPPPDPRELNMNIPASLAALILQMMAKQPGDRPDSAAEVAASFTALLTEIG